ncbi:hypothetical protein MHBO_004390 [Bonamia ostreae]|uniref:Uncharacterized protein n=1 Tax=Bonamia ostreae TaxID=126728 RepID=A0ABV2AT81_9EUKA
MLSKKLGTDVSYFFPASSGEDKTAKVQDKGVTINIPSVDPKNAKDLFTLISEFSRIKDKGVRKKFLTLISSFADNEDGNIDEKIDESSESDD